MRTSFPATSEPTNGGAAVWAVSCSPNGKWIASTTNLGELAAWSVAGNQFTSIDNTVPRLPASLAWSPDSRYVAAGMLLTSATAALQIWSLTGQKLYTYPAYPAPTGEFLPVAWSPDGKYLVVGLENGKVIVWQAPRARSRVSIPQAIRSAPARRFKHIGMMAFANISGGFHTILPSWHRGSFANSGWWRLSLSRTSSLLTYTCRRCLRWLQCLY